MKITANSLDNLTVCVTSWGRGEHLDRALRSCRAAGIRRLTISAAAPTRGVLTAIDDNRRDWLSFEAFVSKEDYGCNHSWEVAAYLAKTPRILVLHDDDVLKPEFGIAYRSEIEPTLRSGVGFASWRARLLYNDGRTKPTEHCRFATGVYPSSALFPIVATQGRLSLSPVISVLDRETVVHACKEAETTLRHNECLERPGMLLGTEILVYLRHVQKYPLWFHLSRVLSEYGSHDGSGTIRAEKEKGGIARLALGYDRARKQAENPPPPAKRRVLIAYYDREPSNPAEALRIKRAAQSRAFLAGTGEAILLPLKTKDLPRIFKRSRKGSLPFLKDLLDLACCHAMPEDIVLYSNDDLGLTTDAVRKILAGVDRGNGVSVFPRRSHDAPHPLLQSVLNCRLDGGIDAVAATPVWWRANRVRFPDMLIGTDCWDTIFRVFAEEWADGGPPRENLEADPHNWLSSRACTDDVCWHEPHLSRWIKERRSGKGDEAGRHNRALARGFFSDRANQDGLRLIAESERKRKK